MKTKKLLQTAGLTILMILLTTLFTNAQIIPIQGFDADNEGFAVWDADGSGLEPEGYGHPVPFGWGSARYYCASKDYDGINTAPDAAFCHFLDNITGFPLFLQALADNGFTPGQVKVKLGLNSVKDDIEGEDWFTIDTMHYYNRYDAYYFIELNGEPMISCYMNYLNCYVHSDDNFWQGLGNFSSPFDASANSSQEVKDVATAFLSDMDGQELRFVFNIVTPTVDFLGPGRINGTLFNIVIAYLEKGLPQLPLIGLASDNEGIAAWDADGTGPEPEAYGHTFTWGSTEYQMPYYFASRDYDNIDPDPGAGLGHATGVPLGFPNLLIQLQYRGYTLDQLQLKSGLGTLGNDEEGVDWALDGNTHWWNSYGNTITFEIDGEPIIEYVIDTNFNIQNMNSIYWNTNSSFSSLVNISENSSSDAQYIATSFFKDLSGHSMRSYMEGDWDASFAYSNGRVDGVFHQFGSGYLEPKLPSGTHIWEGDVRGTWSLEKSPYVIMGEINVPDGEMLIIQPGVEVKFNTTEWFLINGCIIAVGTPEEPILFTALDESVRWGGIGWDQTPVTNETSILKHCIFEYAYAYNPDNLSGYNSGGALAVNDYENIEISHCLFRYNLADKDGELGPSGGAILLHESSLHISHCIFHDNKAGHGGALTVSSNSNAVIDNCLFYENEALDYHGGAVLTNTNCSPSFINCTFADNDAAQGGGVAELEQGGTATFTNCILWGNEVGGGGPSQISIWDPDVSYVNVYYCDVEEGLDGITPGFQGEYIGNIEDDPLFMTVGDYVFVPETILSPCIDMGTMDPMYLPNNYSFPPYCLRGVDRIIGGVDQGCFESDHIDNVFTNPELLNSSIEVYPNPVNPISTIEFYLENDNPVTLSILDIRGKLVSDIQISDLQTGKKRISWNTNGLAPGVYLCRLKAGNNLATRKIIKLH